MDFYLNYTSNFSNKKFYLKELLFKQLKTLNKFIQNKNDDSTNIILDELLKENLVNKNDFYFLNNFDKFCILFLLRIANISADIELKKGISNYKINLLNQFNDLSNFSTETTHTFEDETIKLDLDLPKNLFFNDYFYSNYDCLQNITIKQGPKHKNINLIELKPIQKQKIYESLPAFVHNIIKNYKNKIETSFSSLKINLGTGEPIQISPFNNSLFEIIKGILFFNLNSLYEMQYLLVSKINVNPFYLDNQTFVENMILLQNYNEELKIKSEQNNKSVENPMAPRK